MPNPDPTESKPAPPGGGAAAALAGNVKWIVLGVVALAGMVLFREPLSKLLDRAENVEITKDGVKVSTVRTPLGDTVVSNKGVVPVADGQPGKVTATPGPGGPGAAVPGFKNLRDTQRGFAISWPDNGNWSNHPEMAQALGLNLVLANVAATVQGFTPNVNVVVTADARGIGIGQYLATVAEFFVGQGYVVQQTQFDDVTQSGVQVMVHAQLGIAQIQRVVLREGTSYVVTASRRSGDDREALYAAMGQILNSFELI